ncbi:Uncharacterised protein [Mycobacteroides abscessus]|nr:Uncharacterised protein [Mycobacteroides abscessus]
MCHAIQICPGRSAAAHVPKCTGPVEYLATRRQIDTGQGVLDGLVQTHRDAADCVDHRGEAVEPDFRVVIYAQTSGLFHCSGE